MYEEIPRNCIHKLLLKKMLKYEISDADQENMRLTGATIFYNLTVFKQKVHGGHKPFHQE